MNFKKLSVLICATMTCIPAIADINVGVVGSFTGPVASLGNETKKIIEFLPKTIGNEKVNYIVLDDASDPTKAVTNIRKLISENKVDVVIGPNAMSSAIAMADVANVEKTPMVSVAPLDVSGDNRRFVFRSEPAAELMVNKMVDHMVAKGIKRIAFIGYSDYWGELLLKSLQNATKDKIEIVAIEHYARTDQSVQAQVLKIVAKKPEAVFVGASGTAAAMPQITLKDRGFTGPIYQSHAVANRDFLRVGGKSVEGAILSVGPVLVAEQLPENHPNRASAIQFVKPLDEKYGIEARSTFAGASWDAWLIAQTGLQAALKAGAKPGTEAFRVKVRDGIEEAKNLIGVNGVFNISATDHAGYDPNNIVLIKVQNNKWEIVK